MRDGCLGRLGSLRCSRRLAARFLRIRVECAVRERVSMDERLSIAVPEERSDDVISALASIWEASVRATHDFLTEEDVAALRPEVRSGLAGVEVLEVACLDGEPCGFSGVQGGKLEMLFVAPLARGRGVGKVLLARAVELHGATRLDVNEQNPQAVGFYRHEGFTVSERSAVDDAGRPFPLLRMSLD